MRNLRSVGTAALFLCMSTSPSMGQLGADFQVNSFTLGDQAYPSICRDAADNQVVVWESADQDGDGRGIFARRYAAGGAPIGTEFQVNTHTLGHQQFPGIFCRTGGDFVVVWESRDQDGDGLGVFGQRFASDGTPLGTEFQANAYTTDNQAAGAVVGGPDGSFVVTWQSYGQDGDYGYGVFAKRYDSAGEAVDSEFQVNDYTEYGQSNPALSSDAAGNLVVVWQSDYQDGDSYGIVGRRFDSSGAAQGGEFQINSYTEYAQQVPAVASDDDGNFVVVWESYDNQDGDTYGVFGQRFDSAGVRQGSEFQVSTYTIYSQEKPAIASQPGGGFAVVWSSYNQDGDGSGIFSQRFAPDGLRLGSEFQVNTFTIGDQGAFGFLGRVVDLTTDASGGLSFVWQSTNVFDVPQDGDGFGVFGQRFEFAPTPTPTPRPNGADCSDPDTCESGNCVDGICCEVAQCPVGEFCAPLTGMCQSGPTPTLTSSPTGTATPTLPATSTPTITPTATVTPTATMAPCPGDCNGDGFVTVDELVTGLEVALGQQPSDACPPLDKDGDGTVTIDELVDAVNAALGGCP